MNTRWFHNGPLPLVFWGEGEGTLLDRGDQDHWVVPHGEYAHLHLTGIRIVVNEKEPGAEFDFVVDMMDPDEGEYFSLDWTWTRLKAGTLAFVERFDDGARIPPGHCLRVRAACRKLVGTRKESAFTHVQVDLSFDPIGRAVKPWVPGEGWDDDPLDLSLSRGVV